MSALQFFAQHKAAVLGRIRTALIRRRGVAGLTNDIQVKVDALFALNKAKQQEALALWEKAAVLQRQGGDALNEAKRAQKIANRFQDLLEG